MSRLAYTTRRRVYIKVKETPLCVRGLSHNGRCLNLLQGLWLLWETKYLNICRIKISYVRSRRNRSPLVYVFFFLPHKVEKIHIYRNSQLLQLFSLAREVFRRLNRGGFRKAIHISAHIQGTTSTGIFKPQSYATRRKYSKLLAKVCRVMSITQGAYNLPLII